MARRAISHYNTLRSQAAEDDGTAQSVKNEFARRVEARRIELNMNQADLARATGLGRDRISHYSRGVHLPQPLTLAKIAKALRCSPSDLLPEGGVPATNAGAPFRMVSIDGERCFINVNRDVSFKTAKAIADLLKKEDAK